MPVAARPAVPGPRRGGRARLKADGVEYEERMQLLEEISWPKPLAELLDAAFQIYLAGHPWMADSEPAPKSVLREMVEQGMTFSEFVGSYQLGRSEGAVLRYLSDAYRALRQTVPPDARTEELDDLAEWLGELIRQVDSSLIDEWEQLTTPGAGPGEIALGAGPEADHGEPPGVPDPGAQRVVPPGAAGRPGGRRHPRRTRPRHSASTDGRRRWTTTTPTTTRSAPTPTPAARGTSSSTRRSSTPGRCGRSSPTRPATTTGRSPPRSTWPPPMPRVTS